MCARRVDLGNLQEGGNLYLLVEDDEKLSDDQLLELPVLKTDQDVELLWIYHGPCDNRLRTIRLNAIMRVLVCPCCFFRIVIPVLPGSVRDMTRSITIS